MKKLFTDYGIPTPAYKVFEPGQRVRFEGLKFPLILKPVFEHCGIAIEQSSVVFDKRDARAKIKRMTDKYNQAVLAEEYIDGRELHITILENNGKPWVLPPAEVVFEDKNGFLPILTYDAKWVEQSDEYESTDLKPAELDDRIWLRVKKVAEKCYVKLGGRDYPRLDIRLDRKGRVYVLELNNNPGIDYEESGGIGMSARLVYLSFEDLVSHIVENAWKRFHQGYYSEFGMNKFSYL